MLTSSIINWLRWGRRRYVRANIHTCIVGVNNNNNKCSNLGYLSSGGNYYIIIEQQLHKTTIRTIAIWLNLSSVLTVVVVKRSEYVLYLVTVRQAWQTSIGSVKPGKKAFRAISRLRKIKWTEYELQSSPLFYIETTTQTSDTNEITYGMTYWK